MFAERARELGLPVAFCNMVGGQDELVFDGHSFVVDAEGELVARARQFEPDLLLWDPNGGPARITEPLADLAEVYAALVLGVRDYTRKNGFERALVGLSGGIDSALVALIAADALGPERLTCVVMPSPHSSDATQADARAIARNLGAELIELPIGEAMGAYDAIPGRALVRRRARGRERAGEDPRQPADGALQRPRRLGADDRQQERDVGRLRDPLRRHGRRPGGDQGRAEAGRLRAGRAPKRARRPRAGAALGARAPALGRAARRPARRGLAAALRAARPGARGLRRARPLALASWSPRACRARSSTR